MPSSPTIVPPKTPEWQTVFGPQASKWPQGICCCWQLSPRLNQLKGPQPQPVIESMPTDKITSNVRFMAVISVGSAPPCRGSQFRVANKQLYNRVDDVQTKHGEFFLLLKLTEM